MSTTVTVLPDTVRKIEFLEAVRGVASLIVVLQHLFAAEFPAFELWSRSYVDAGRVGVIAFFMVSGYVIPLSLQHQTSKTFLTRRLFRLFPIYWLILALMMLFIGFIGDGEFGGSLTVMANVFMIQGAIGLFNIVPTAWTLGIELIFYAQSLMAKVFRLLNGAVNIGYFWLAVFLVAALIGRLLERELPYTLPLLLYTASLGHSIHLKDRDGNNAWRWLAFAGIVGIPVGAFINGGQDPAWTPFVYSASFVIGIATFAAFYITRRLPHPRLLSWLGAVSYGMYLIHPLVYRVIALVGLQPGLMRVITALGVTILCSYLVHRFVELPFISLSRRLTR